MIIYGPDYIRAKCEESFAPHFSLHCMNIKIRELLLQKMFGGNHFLIFLVLYLEYHFSLSNGINI
jgi:hypothetical protein